MKPITGTTTQRVELQPHVVQLLFGPDRCCRLCSHRSGRLSLIAQQENGRIHLRIHQGARENLCRPSVDVLFRSITEVYAELALAVVLTGMGQDGLKGYELLRAAGGRVFVQDEATSVVWGKPGFVARAGLADKILPLDQVAREIIRATTLQVAARSQP